MAGGATKDEIHFSRDVGIATDAVSAKIFYGSWDYSTTWKIEFVDASVDGIDLDSRHYIESCLLKTKGHATSASKEVNSKGATVRWLLKEGFHQVHSNTSEESSYVESIF